MKTLPISKVDEIIQKYKGLPGSLLSILEEIQNSTDGKYLPEDALVRVGEKTGVPLSRIYSVATFYSFFNLVPQGKHTITVCRGTACHTRKSNELFEYLKNNLDFSHIKSTGSEKALMTTSDGNFTIRTVACFGQCALAPVVEIDGVIYGHMTVEKLKKMLKKLQSEEKKKWK